MPSTEAAAADIRDTFERVLLAQFGLALLLSIWAPDLTGTALLPISPSARLESAGSVRRGSRLTQGERWVCVRRAGGDIRLSVAHIQGREAALICTPRNPNPSPGAVTQARAAPYNSKTGEILWPVQAGILKPTEPTWVESPTEPAVSLSPSSEGQSSDSHPTRVCPPALVLASAVVGTRWLLLGESQQANQTKGFQRYRCPDHATPHRQHTHTVILGGNACSTSGSARWRCW